MRIAKERIDHWTLWYFSTFTLRRHVFQNAFHFFEIGDFPFYLISMSKGARLYFRTRVVPAVHQAKQPADFLQTKA